MAGLTQYHLDQSKRLYRQTRKLEFMKEEAIDGLKESVENRNWIGAIAWKEEIDKLEAKLMKLRVKNLT